MLARNIPIEELGEIDSARILQVSAHDRDRDLANDTSLTRFYIGDGSFPYPILAILTHQPSGELVAMSGRPVVKDMTTGPWASIGCIEAGECQSMCAGAENAEERHLPV